MHNKTKNSQGSKLMINRSKQVLSMILTIALLISFTSTASANTLRDQLLKAADPKISGEYVRNRFLKLMKKPFNQTAKKKALIIGDSHAQDFLNSVLENNYLSDYQISTRYIPTRCQVFLGEKGAQLIDSKDKIFCAKSDSLLQAKKQIADADLIILAANWKEWSAKELPQTIERLSLRSEQKLFVIGRKSFGKVSIRKYLRLSKEKLLTLRNKADAKQNKISNIMSKTINKAILVEQQQLVCGSSATCPVFTKDLELISFDGGHLTKAGARYIGKVLFQGSELGSL